MLPRVLEDLKNQTFNDFLWVLVNDAGDSQPVDRIAQQAQALNINVQVIHRDMSTGMEAASNHGIQATTSTYVVIHDDDDTWEPNFLQQTAGYLDRFPDAPGVVTWSNRVDEEITDNRIIIRKKYPYNHGLLSIYLSDLAISNQFPPISFLFRRSFYDSVGGFDETLPVLGDWDFHLRMLMKGDLHVIPEGLANYHWRLNTNPGQYGNSVTSGIDKHVFFDAAYRNQKLRDDLLAGKNGIGTLLAIGRMLNRFEHALGLVERLANVARRSRLISVIRRFIKT